MSGLCVSPEDISNKMDRGALQAFWVTPAAVRRGWLPVSEVIRSVCLSLPAVRGDPQQNPEEISGKNTPQIKKENWLLSLCGCSRAQEKCLPAFRHVLYRGNDVICWRSNVVFITRNGINVQIFKCKSQSPKPLKIRISFMIKQNKNDLES